MISRIKTKEEISKKKRTNQLIAGSLLLIVIVLSTISIAFLSTDNTTNIQVQKVTENGIEFTRQNYYWNTNLEGQNYYFQYLPSEVSGVEVLVDSSLQDYFNKELFFVNSNSATSEILVNLNPFLSGYSEACLENQNCTNQELPIKTCEDNLIIFEESTNSSVTKQDNCIYIKGDYIRSSDAFLYKLLNII